MSEKIRYNQFLNVELPEQICEGIELCFTNIDIDPEVAWAEFREGLRKIKKKHLKLFLECEETDRNTPTENEITRWWRRDN